MREMSSHERYSILMKAHRLLGESREEMRSRISRKTGMRLVRIEDQDFVSGRLPAEIWEITAEEWLDWRKRTSKPALPVERRPRQPARPIMRQRRTNFQRP